MRLEFDVTGVDADEIERRATAVATTFFTGPNRFVKIHIDAEPEVMTADGTITLWTGHVRATDGNPHLELRTP